MQLTICNNHDNAAYNHDKFLISLQKLFYSAFTNYNEPIRRVCSKIVNVTSQNLFQIKLELDIRFLLGY